MSEVFGQALRRQKNGQEHVKSVSLHSNFPSPSGTRLAEKPGPPNQRHEGNLTIHLDTKVRTSERILGQRPRE